MASLVLQRLKITKLWSAMKIQILQKANNSKIQSNHNDDWIHNYYVASMLFLSKGNNTGCFIEVQICVHNSQVADWGDIYDKLKLVYKNTGDKCVFDLAYEKLEDFE